MKAIIYLNSKGNKNLYETIYDIIDILAEGDIQKIGFKAAHWTFGIFGDDGTNALFALAKPFFEGMANGFFKDNNIFATLKIQSFTKKEEQLQITADLEDIDYIKTLTKNQKRIIKNLKTRSPKNVTWEILGVIDKETTPLVTKILKTINDEKKEAIIKLLIKEFQTNICKTLSGLLHDNKIELCVKKISIA